MCVCVSVCFLFEPQQSRRSARRLTQIFSSPLFPSSFCSLTVCFVLLEFREMAKDVREILLTNAESSKTELGRPRYAKLTKTLDNATGQISSSHFTITKQRQCVSASEASWWMLEVNAEQVLVAHIHRAFPLGRNSLRDICPSRYDSISFKLAN